MDPAPPDPDPNPPETSHLLSPPSPPSPLTSSPSVHPLSLSLHRALPAHHISMLILCGAIGNGLIIASGPALALGGPASLLLSYLTIALLAFTVMTALGEMATWLPVPGNFAEYASRWVDPALGFAVGWTYWLKYVVTTPNQITAAAMCMGYWVESERVNAGWWVAIGLGIAVGVNAMGVRGMGGVEYAMGVVKVVVLVVMIVVTGLVVCGVGGRKHVVGFESWREPGAFNEYILEGAAGRFLAVWSNMVYAVFGYLGLELVGITVGEAENPRRNIPKAIKDTFLRIATLYVISVLVLGMAVPYNSPGLISANGKGNSAAASPFVVAVQTAGIDSLPAVFNAFILVFLISAAIADLYIASRTLHGLALKGHAPRFLARTDSRGVPMKALVLCSLICCLAFANAATESTTVFMHLLNMVAIFGLMTWISVLISHICFVRARRAQRISDSKVPYRAPLGVLGSTIALAFCCTVAVTHKFGIFARSPWDDDFDTATLITGYMGIPLYLLLITGYKLTMRSSIVDPLEADLFTGKAAIDADEQEWLLRESEVQSPRVKHRSRFRRILQFLF